MARYGTGSVYQRKDGRWAASAIFDGQRVTRYGKTKKDAQQKLKELHADPPTPTITPTFTTVAEFATDWIRSADLKPLTVSSYRQMLRVHINPIIGDLPLDDVTPVHIGKIIATARASGRSDRTVQYAYVLARRVLQVATDWELIDRNPARRSNARPFAVKSAEYGPLKSATGSLTSADVDRGMTCTCSGFFPDFGSVNCSG